MVYSLETSRCKYILFNISNTHFNRCYFSQPMQTAISLENLAIDYMQSDTGICLVCLPQAIPYNLWVDYWQQSV